MDGGLTMVDNTRAVAAGHAGIGVQVNLHEFDEEITKPTRASP
jgi:hypothetical protein